MSEFVEPGTVIGGKYRVERPIARGGFSTVYYGLQIGLDRPVALKLLDLTKEIEDTWLIRFEREAKLVSNLSHPNTITIIDYGREASHLFIAMEYVRGRSLNKQIKKFGALDPLPVAQVALQVCRSLEEAHSYGILHRDLKPSNIMLARGPEGVPIVKVLDFGVAKVLEPVPDVDLQLTQQGVFVGTPRYAAPEQLVHEPVDARTDVYGVGMVMWEALVGDPAVPELDYGACIEYHLGPEPWVLPDWISCPPGLADIVHRALQKRAPNRYNNISELANELERFIHSHAGELDEAMLKLLAQAEPSEPSIDLPGDAMFSGIGRQVSESEPTDEAPPLLAPTRREVDTKRLELKENLQPQKPKSFRETDGDDIAIDISKLPPKQNLPIETQEMSQRVSRQKKSMNPWMIVGLGASALVAIVLAVGFFASRDEPAPIVEQEAPPKTLTLEDEFIINAMRTTGWDVRVGDTVSYYDGIQQTTVSAKKKSDRAHLTIFECESMEKVRFIQAQRAGPVMDVDFGKTLVRIRDTNTGAGKAYNTLKTLQEMSSKKAVKD